MRLISTEYMTDEGVYRFFYEHKYRGVVQDLEFRYPEANPSYNTYRLWKQTGIDSAKAHIKQQIDEEVNKIQLFTQPKPKTK